MCTIIVTFNLHPSSFTFILYFVLLRDFCDGPEGMIVQSTIGGEDADIFTEFASQGEIQRIAAEIAYPPAGFLNDNHPGGVVPDFFPVAGAAGQA